MIRGIKGRASHIRMFLGSAWPDNPKTFHSHTVHIIRQGGRLTLKIAAVVFLLLAVMALEAAGALGTSDQPMREVDAGEILAKVEAGQPVEYDHVVVRGDLDLSSERLHKNVTSPISINDSVFSGRVSFNGTIFEKQVDLSGSNFTRDAYFRGATFSSNVDFSLATFIEDVDFWRATFIGYADFSLATFSSNVYFSSATFIEDVDFWRTTFIGYADFSEATFGGNANFGWTTFSSNAYFTVATFSGDANFWEPTFSGDTYFGGAGFTGYAYFTLATFTGYVHFCGATFRGNSSFEDAEFNGITEFGDARFENDTSFYRILFKRPAYFENCSIESLNLTKTEYSRLHLHWDGIKSLHFDESTYLALIKNYYSLGWYDDANDCYYDYRNAVRRSWQDASSPGFAARFSSLLDRLIDFGEWILYGYGVRPSFPIAWSAAIILAFGLFFWKKRCLRKIITEERIEDARDGSDEVLVQTKARKAPINFLDPFLFSLFTFTSGFTAFLHPAVEYKLERCLRWAIAERLLGPFLLALVITTISKTYLIR